MGYLLQQPALVPRGKLMEREQQTHSTEDTGPLQFIVEPLICYRPTKTTIREEMDVPKVLG